MKTQPSSLPVSERLRFFSSLTESRNRNSGSYTRSPPLGCIERSVSVSSYGTYFMPTTPRSSTSQSSASVTPTPMECGGPQQWPAVLTESPTILRKDQGPKVPVVEVVNQTLVVNKNATIHDFTDSRDVIKADFVKTSPFLQTVKPASATPAHLANTDTTPTSTLTPTMKRIKLKTIGKLMLPTTFLNNDRNNNHTSTNGGCGSSGVVSAKETSNTATTAAATLSEQISVESNDSSSQQPPKKIGKIKSPFIENCNQMQQNKVQLNTKCMKFDYRPNSTTTTTTTTALSSVENSNDHHHHNSNNGIGKYFNNSAPILTNGHSGHHGQGHQQEDASTDSGKENIDTSSSNCSENTNTSMTKTTTPVGEIRRKFTRKNNNNTQSLNTSSGPTTRTQLTPRSASFNGSGSHTSSPQIDSKYAKYFGMATSSNSSLNSSSGTKMSQENGTTAPPLPKQPPPQMKVSEKSNNTSVVEQRLKSSPTASANATEAFNHHVNNHHWQNHRTSPRGLKRSMTGHITELKKYEDIVVTERELKLAAKEFDNLLCSESVLQQPPTMVIELEKIFSSIV